MIAQVDEALRSIVRAEALDGADVEVVFDAPTRDWAARRNAPTVNLYLYDIREDLRRRETGWVEKRDANSSIVTRAPIPRFFKLSYLVTAWTKRPEDEHRLLAALLRCFVRFDAMPAELVTGVLATTGLDVALNVALPPPEDRAFADVWTALGGELKPSLDVVVIAPVDIGIPQTAGAPVTDGAYFDVHDQVDGGSDVHRHRHTPPEPSAATADAAAVGAQAGGKGASAGRKPRTRRRDGA